MGTVGAYSGSGGKAGKDLREGVEDWLNELPTSPPNERPEDSSPDGDSGGDVPRLNPETLLNVLPLMRPGSVSGGRSDGPGGGGGGGSTGSSGGGRSGGGASRSVGGSARTAGRAAAAARAFSSGDVDTLAGFGLDYAALAALNDPIEVVRQIVEAACGARADSTIEDHEQRLVAAEVAEWVLSEDGNAPPAPEEIVRHTIAIIIADTALVETADEASRHANGELLESEVREVAEALAARVPLSVDGTTEDEFAAAIESGIETLRTIREAD